GTVLPDALVASLAKIEKASRYSLEIRISLDGYTEEMNDRIRGEDVFSKVLAAIACLSRCGLLPLITIVRTWPEHDELSAIGGFTQTLKEAGYSRPRI